MGVLTQCVREKGDFFSNIFIRPKQDGKYRMILNLKPFNKYLQYHHFKMDKDSSSHGQTTLLHGIY